VLKQWLFVSEIRDRGRRKALLKPQPLASEPRPLGRVQIRLRGFVLRGVEQVPPVRQQPARVGPPLDFAVDRRLLLL
jgi:hypothetical protein